LFSTDLAVKNIHPTIASASSLVPHQGARQIVLLEHRGDVRDVGVGYAKSEEKARVVVRIQQNLTVRFSAVWGVILVERLTEAVLVSWSLTAYRYQKTKKK
jgi:hypothetical protein